jgi:hypothetical protein
LGGHRKSDRRKPFATDATPVPQDCATTFGRIAAQKAVLSPAANFRRLILTFHAMIPLNCAWSNHWIRTLNDGVQHTRFHGVRELISESTGVKVGRKADFCVELPDNLSFEPGFSPVFRARVAFAGTMQSK